MGLMALRSSKTAPVVSSLVTSAYIIIATAALEIVTAAAAAGVKLAQVLGDVALDPFVHVLHPGHREGVFKKDCDEAPTSIMYTIFNSEHGQTSLLPPDVVCGVALAPAVADGPGAAAGGAQHHVLAAGAGHV